MTRREFDMSRLFKIIVSGNSANHGDGTNENYTFQAYALNGEALSFTGVGYTLADAAAAFAKSMQHVKVPDHLGVTRDGTRPHLAVE